MSTNPIGSASTRSQSSGAMCRSRSPEPDFLQCFRERVRTSYSLCDLVPGICDKNFHQLSEVGATVEYLAVSARDRKQSHLRSRRHCQVIQHALQTPRTLTSRLRNMMAHSGCDRSHRHPLRDPKANHCPSRRVRSFDITILT